MCGTRRQSPSPAVVSKGHTVTVFRVSFSLCSTDTTSRSAPNCFTTVPSTPPLPPPIRNTPHPVTSDSPPPPPHPLPSVCLPSIGVTLTVVAMRRAADGTFFDVGFFSFPPLPCSRRPRETEGGHLEERRETWLRRARPLSSFTAVLSRRRGFALAHRYQQLLRVRGKGGVINLTRTDYVRQGELDFERVGICLCAQLIE